MSIFKKLSFLEIWTFFQGRLPRPNHYAHEVRSEILSRTPVSILKYLSPRPQNLRKTFNNSSLAWMSTWISKWRRRRRRRFPKNSLHLVGPLEHHAQEPNIPFGDSLTSTNWAFDPVVLNQVVGKSQEVTKFSVVHCAWMFIRNDYWFP